MSTTHRRGLGTATGAGAVVGDNVKAATAIVFQAIVSGIASTVAIQGSDSTVIAVQATALGTDQVIINAAITYVNGLGGGSVFVDEGTYTQGANVALLASVYLYGSGAATILTIAAATDDCIEVNGATDWKLALMTLRTTGAGANDALTLVDADDGEIFSIVIDDSGQDGIIVDGDCSNVNIHDNMISTCTRYGINNSGDNVQIRGNRVDATGDDNIWVQATADGTIVRENRLSNWTGEALDDDGTNTDIPEIYMPVIDPNGNLGDYPVVILTDGVDTTIRFQLKVPKGFQDLVRADVVVVQIATGGSPDMQWSTTTDFGQICADEAYNLHSDSETDQTTALTQNDLECVDISASLTDIAAEDLVGITFIRRGTQGGDVVNADVYYLGFRVHYV